MISSVALDPQDLLNHAIEAHYAEIKAAVMRRGHGAVAADIVHDLYLKLAAQPEVLQGRRSVKAFLCRAAINLGFDRLRRSRLETRLFSGTEDEAIRVLDAAAVSDAGLAVEARLTALKAAIIELPARRRAVFVLHRLHAMAPDEIAARLGISRNMVDRHLRRALAHCLDRLFALD